MRNNELFKYAGMATQFLVTLGVAIFIGLKIDRWIAFGFPIATVTLPLLILVATFLKIFRDTNNR
jgi:uncharacterized membrane protein YhiD involved in acid resistance